MKKVKTENCGVYAKMRERKREEKALMGKLE
jgi:hypothetical protein